MTINPMGIILVVLGFVAVVVGVKGTQGPVAQLLTGRSDAGSSGAPAGGVAAPSLPKPTHFTGAGSTAHTGAGATDTGSGIGIGTNGGIGGIQSFAPGAP